MRYRSVISGSIHLVSAPLILTKVDFIKKTFGISSQINFHVSLGFCATFACIKSSCTQLDVNVTYDEPNVFFLQYIIYI